MDSNIETLYHLFDSRVEAIEFKVDEASDITDKPLMELNLRNHLLVSCIYRNGVAKIPSGQDKILVGDTVIIVTTHMGLDKVTDILV